MRQGHLSDDRLIEVCVDTHPLPGERQHLDGCVECEQRLDDIEQMLQDCQITAIAEADLAFSEERLARQRTRILQRIDHDGRPGRVISFPVSHGEPAVVRRRPSSRWVAVAAAAGLVIGLVAGELAHQVGGIGTAPAAALNVPSAAAAARAVGAPALSDEEFLVLMDRAIQRAGGSALGPLDEMTPRVWEVAAR